MENLWNRTKGFFAYQAGYSSDHPGGCIMLFSDGATLFVTEGIDCDRLERLLHRKDGESVDLSEFR